MSWAQLYVTCEAYLTVSALCIQCFQAWPITLVHLNLTLTSTTAHVKARHTVMLSPSFLAASLWWSGRVFWTEDNGRATDGEMICEAAPSHRSCLNASLHSFCPTSVNTLHIGKKFWISITPPIRIARSCSLNELSLRDANDCSALLARCRLRIPPASSRSTYMMCTIAPHPDSASRSTAASSAWLMVSKSSSGSRPGR